MTQTPTALTAEDAAASLADVLHLLDRLDESAQDMDPDLIRAAVPQALREWVTAKYPAPAVADATAPPWERPQPVAACRRPDQPCTSCQERQVGWAGTPCEYADATADQPQPDREDQAAESKHTCPNCAPGYDCARGVYTPSV